MSYHQFELLIQVHDPGKFWRATRKKMIEEDDFGEDDIEENIGTETDPNINHCVMYLFDVFEGEKEKGYRPLEAHGRGMIWETLCHKHEIFFDPEEGPCPRCRPKKKEKT